MKLLVLKKSKDYAEKLKKLKERRGDTPDDKLEHFRKLLMDHLDTLDDGVMEKAGLPVGTIREWKGGRKYIKIGPGKWRPKYDNESRGAKMAVAAIRRKVAAAKDAHEMMQIILEHRDRFSDKDGHPLPFVMELHNYIMSTQDSREKASASEEEKKQASEQEEGKQEGGNAEPEKGGQDKDGKSRKSSKKQKTKINDKNGKLIPGTRMTGAEWKEYGYTHADDVNFHYTEIHNDRFYTATNRNNLQETFEDFKARDKRTGGTTYGSEETTAETRKLYQEVLKIAYGGRIPTIGEIDPRRIYENPNIGEIAGLNAKGTFFALRPGLNDNVLYIDENGDEAITNYNLLDNPSQKKLQDALREYIKAKGVHFEGSKYGELGNDEPEKTEDEKRRNRSEAMKGNKNAYKGGPKPQSKAEAKAEEEDTRKARSRAGLPPVEKHGRTSTMKDSTWDPKSKDYRYRDTGYIAGSRKELAQSYIKSMAKNGVQVTNDSIDWTGIEENDVAAAEIITKQNLMGKPDWEALQVDGLTGGAGYLINELYKTINSKPEKSTADTRYDFSRGLDAIRSRLEACKTLDDVKTAAGEINGEITGYYVSAIKTPEYLELSKKQEAQNEKIKAHQDKLKKKIYEEGDPYHEADAFLKNKMGISSGVRHLINPADGSWKGSFYDMRGKNELLELLREGDVEYKRRQDAIEERTGTKLDDMGDQLREINVQMNEAKQKKNEELGLANDMSKAWETFGKSFSKAVAVLTKDADRSMYWGTSLDRNETFQKHYEKAGEIAPDDFSWSGKKSAGGGGGPRKTQFELKVADHIVRRGGREVKAESTEALKNLFNLRDVQSGNWVLNDTKSAKFHVDNIAMGLSDLADITGIPDNLVSLNGRLAIAIGARGHSKALAHYEPVERVINITKMKGGGNLGHEWFHAFDNLIADAMTGGRYNIFLTDNGRYDDLTARQRKLLDRALMYKKWMGNTKEESSYYKSYQKDYEDAKAEAKKAGVSVDEIDESEDHIATVKNAFANLAKTMMTGSATRTEDIYYTKDDYAYINSDEGKRMLGDLHVSKEGMDFDEALEKASRYRRIYGKKQEQVKRLLAAYYDGNENGGGKSAKTKETTSRFFEDAKRLESNPGKPYWSSIIEMGARAFSAYLNDKMAERGWENNYLAHATENSGYDNHSPYPAGEEREGINAAFDQLFKVINESNAIRKAIDLENMERIAPENSGPIDAAIEGALRFFHGLSKGRGSFDREKVILNRAGEDIEAYRWIATKQPDVMLALDKQAVAPHAELIQEDRGGEKTIAIDFDGVINSYKSGWKGPTETDEPVLSAAEGISGLWNRGHKIIIFSTRAQTPEGAETIREYLRKHTENDLLANSIEITDRKPVADVYVDDRAITFTGNWEETLEKIETFEPWVAKSLTYSGYPLQGRAKIQDMDISIENKKGSTRNGTDKDGHDWSVTMNYDYGYIRGTVGVDKDHLDAYVGPNPESEIVYIVNQNDPVTGQFDEQKVMLGFNSEEEAKAAYLKQYDRPGFFGNIMKMDIDTFKEKAFDVRNKGKPLQKMVS